MSSELYQSERKGVWNERKSRTQQNKVIGSSMKYVRSLELLNRDGDVQTHVDIKIVKTRASNLLTSVDTF
ncbi:hypothetical protein E2C01_001776 [Portunus trituberculatus]|uniref:Uncharacterized protein n=1 Tax=Portunus trituberculatus TaxID=210409 RepID=A0A5B7CHJ1_PORTR|nr:hypothetical protein [Portunus trituberculatus]